LNVAIVGHSHDGKTSLAESLLFAAGASPRLGSTDQGTALLDYEPEEQRRHISVQLGIACLRWKELPLAILDTPGFQDFEGEVLEALAVADAAVLVVGANSGGHLPVGAESGWDLLATRQLPRLIVITKLDKEHADFDATYASLQRQFSPRPIALQIPIGAEHSFNGAVDLLTGRAVLFEPQGGYSEAD
jgi:elongation factor G